jgi:hypothetical protein
MTQNNALSDRPPRTTLFVREEARQDILANISAIIEQSRLDPWDERLLDVYWTACSALGLFLDAEEELEAPSDSALLHLRKRLVRHIADLGTIYERGHESGHDAVLARSYQFLLSVAKQYLEDSAKSQCLGS